MAVETLENNVTVTNKDGETVTYKVEMDTDTWEFTVVPTKYTAADGTSKTVGSEKLFSKDKFANQAVLDKYGLETQQLEEIEKNLISKALIEVPFAYNNQGYQTPPWAHQYNSKTNSTPLTNPNNNPPNSNETSQLNQAAQAILDQFGLGGIAQVFDIKNNLGQVGINTNYKSGIGPFKNRTLVYPINLKVANLSKDMDTCVIEQFNYVPPNENEFLSGKVDIFKQGLSLDNDYADSQGRLKEGLGKVILPMPQSFEEKRGVQYGEDTMNTLAAGMTQRVVGNPSGFMGAAVAGGLAGLIAQALGGNGGSSIGLGGIGGAARTGIAAYALGQAGSAVLDNADGQQLLSSVMSSNILKAAGVNVSAETILARGAGVVPNPNMELLFRSPLLRNFGLVYRLTARSKDEGDEIRRIIRFFKQGMSPRNTVSGVNYFIKTPNVFAVSFKTSNDDRNIALPKFKVCALRGFTTDYAPDKMWAAYDKGQPVSTTIVMEFGELTPIYSGDFENLPEDDIGY